MNSLKSFFKYTLRYKKGKVLDEKLISFLSTQLEQDFLDFLYNEGFMLKNCHTDSEIKVTGSSDKQITVNPSGDWSNTREYDTLIGAMKASDKVI